jgi:hypothetical protein
MARKADENQRWLAKVAKEPVALSPVDEAALKDLRTNQGSGKVRLIALWSPANQPSVAQFDQLVEHNLRFRTREFEVITVAAEKSAEQDNVRAFLQRHHASMKNLIASFADAREVARTFNPASNGTLPQVVVVNPEGKVLYEQVGPTDFLALRRALLPALDATAPWPANGK